MPSQKKVQAPKPASGRASADKRLEPETRDAGDAPQREDEFLSKFLRNSNPESKGTRGPKKD